MGEKLYDDDVVVERPKVAKKPNKPGPAARAGKGLTAAGIDVKWGQNAWNASEVSLGDFDLMVLRNLVHAAKGNIDEDTMFKVMGEHLYVAIRPSLNIGTVKLLDTTDSRASTPTPLPSLKQGKKGGRGKGGNKAKMGPSRADQIRMQNSMGTLCNKVETSLQAVFNKGDDFQRPSLLIDKIIELRGIGFLCCAWYLLTKRKTLEWDRDLKILTYTVIVSLQRFIKSATKIKGKSHLDSSKEDIISSTLISDLECKLLELKDKFKFNGGKIYLEAPQLLIFSDLDDTLPKSAISPYPHQARICEILKENMQNGFYVMYRAVTNAGKTTTIVSLAATVQKIREENPDNENFAKLQIIFCCGSSPVKEQAAQWLYNTANVNAIDQLPFALAFMCPERGLVIRNSWSCRATPDDRLVIVCSPSVASIVLKQPRRPPYILFHDEPTIGAESLESREIQNNVQLLSTPPKWTIVSSATLPSEDDLAPFIRRHRAHYPMAHHENVLSNSINIGCDVYSHTGDTYLPHLGIKDQKSLTQCISNISNNMFLSRTYTPLSVSELSDHSKGCIDIPDIGTHFTDINNLSANSVRLYGLKILDLLSKKEDEIVSSVCCKHINGNSRTVEFDKLGTTGAYKFPQMSLIACEDPVTFALDNFKDLLDHMKSSKYTIEKLVNQYWKVQNQWSDEVARMRKKRTKPKPTKRESGEGKDDEAEEVDYAQLEMDLMANKPYISFPECYQINTKHHLDKYAPSNTNITARFQLPDFSFITDNKMNVSSDLQLLLCSGVGIYAPENAQAKNDSYLTLVKSLAQKGRLAYLVADHNISYGVNFPFSRSIINEDFSEAHSMNTVFQLMSRAGRVGQSWFAEAFVSDKVVRTLKDHAQQQTCPDNKLEVNNLITILTRQQDRARQQRKQQRLAGARE